MLKGIKKSIQSSPLRSLATQLIVLGLLWNSLILVTGCKSPVTVVISGSMEPAYKRGDLLFLNNMRKTPFYEGEVVVFKIKGKEIPIVHRIIEVHRGDNSDQVLLLTKGDNNSVDDSEGIYAKGQKYLEKDHIIGRVRGHLPYVGYATIVLEEHPLIKYLTYLLLGGLILRDCLRNEREKKDGKEQKRKGTESLIS